MSVVTEVRPTWRLYRFRMPGELLYVGQTKQVALERREQHVESKWWAVLATTWEVDPQIFYSLADVLAAEEAAIHAEKPRCNVVHNQGNPDRWRSMADVPLDLRPQGVTVEPARRLPDPKPAVPVRRKPWTSRRKASVWAAVAWLLADLVWAWPPGLSLPTGRDVMLSTVGTLVAFLFVRRTVRRW